MKTNPKTETGEGNEIAMELESAVETMHNLIAERENEGKVLRDDLRDDGQAYGGLGESYSSRNI